MIDASTLCSDVFRRTVFTTAMRRCRGVALDRGVDEALDLGKGDHLVELGIDLAFAHAEYSAVEVDVLAAGKLGMKACADLQE